MIICLFVCLFVCWPVCFFILIFLEHPQEYTLKISWRSDLIWLRYIGSKNVYLFFVCLFIDVFVFCLNHGGATIESYPDNFVKIPLYLADILRIKNMFICLFLCLFVCWPVCFYFNHLRTPTGIYPEIFARIWLDLAEIFRI